MMRNRWVKYTLLIGFAFFSLAGISLVATLAYMPRTFGGWHENRLRLTRSALPSDVLGTWQYMGDSPATSITITFHDDHTFDQVVIWSKAGDPMRPIKSTGHWQINGDDLLLDDVLMTREGTWQPPDHIRWYVAQSETHPNQPAIYGSSDPDPDGFEELTRLPK